MPVGKLRSPLLGQQFIEETTRGGLVALAQTTFDFGEGAVDGLQPCQTIERCAAHRAGGFSLAPFSLFALRLQMHMLFIDGPQVFAQPVQQQTNFLRRIRGGHRGWVKEHTFQELPPLIGGIALEDAAQRFLPIRTHRRPQLGQIGRQRRHIFARLGFQSRPDAGGDILQQFGPFRPKWSEVAYPGDGIERVGAFQPQQRQFQQADGLGMALDAAVQSSQTGIQRTQRILPVDG